MRDDVLLLMGEGSGGYFVYRRASPSAPSVLVADLDDDVLSYTLADLDASSVQYYYVEAYSECGVLSEANIQSRLRRVAMDASNELIAPAPNAPYALELVQGEGGTVTAQWQHRNANGEEACAGFNVYLATGEDAFDYGSVDFAVGSGVRSQLLGTFANTTAVRCVVRARTDEGVEETNTTEASIAADAAAPAAPTEMTIL
jgi:hypothetical protein